MRILRLAQLFELKYSLKAEAASIQDVMRDVVEKIKLVFLNYIDPKSVTSKAYNGIPVFASRNEPHCNKIMGHMYFIVAQIDELSARPGELYTHVNKVLALTDELDKAIKHTKKQTKEFLPSQQVLNDNRSDLKRLEESIRRVSHQMTEVAKVLKRFLTDPAAIQGGTIVPGILPLSKEQRLHFLRTPEAEQYGFNAPDIIDNLDVLQRLFEEPGFTEKYDRLVRAVKSSSAKRGPSEQTSSEIIDLVKYIKQRIMDRGQTNLPALQKMPEKPAAPIFPSDEEDK